MKIDNTTSNLQNPLLGRKRNLGGKLTLSRDREGTLKGGLKSPVHALPLGVSTRQNAVLSGPTLFGNTSKKTGTSGHGLLIEPALRDSNLSKKAGTSGPSLLTKPTLYDSNLPKITGSASHSLLAKPSAVSLKSSFQLSSVKGTSHHSHLGDKLSGSSHLLNAALATRPSSKVISSTNALLHQASAKKTKPASDHGHIAESPTFEVSLPDYSFNFKNEDFESLAKDEDEAASFPDVEAQEMGIEVALVDVSTKKSMFINSVSASLIGGPQFNDRHDVTRLQLIQQADGVVQHDPEFLLKVALYTRKELNIRSTANFLLALATKHKECRPYLRKYFKASVALPSDWSSVAELYTTFFDKSINYGSLPAALRKAMVAKFPDFDEYQLAKYNKKKNTPSKAAKPKNNTDVDSDEDSEEHLEAVSFTLKQLIRKLHITEPAEHVMCLLGKKYPEDLESFRKSKLPGTWESCRANERMRLPTPETWETKIATCGNWSYIWEDLIDNKKLPFMAMLRNLRNMIQAGIDTKYHNWVLKKLTDEGAVIHSKQFPFRFFSAYEVLIKMEKALDSKDKPPAPTLAVGQGRGGRKGAFKRQIVIRYDRAILKRYRKALDTATKIATCYNVKPIRGTTLLFCDAGANMLAPCASANAMGKPLSKLQIGILLGLMCKYSCEECTMILCGNKTQQTVELEKGTILDNMESVLKCAAAIDDYSGGRGVLNENTFFEMLRDRVQIDNILLLSDCPAFGSGGRKGLQTFLRKYRRLVNPNLLFVSVDLSGAKCSFSTPSDSFQHPNDVHIAGYSDQILRYVAERGDGGQLNHVENIDKGTYDLPSIPITSVARQGLSRQVSVQPQMPLSTVASPQTKRWRTARVFISSTFRDMHGERDLLTRFVFPELRARARMRCINLYEVDLRWGVTEEATKQNKALDICLSEVSRCDLFIGILGERYGHIPNSYKVSDSEEFDWLKNLPAGCSVTELEILHAALNKPEDAVDRAFFYIRDPVIISKIPKRSISVRKDFEAESNATKKRLQKLKDRLRTSGLEVYDGYPCEFGGVVDGHAVVNKLDEFGQRVINNLWNALLMHYPEEDTFQDETTHQAALHDAYMETHVQSFTGRITQINNALDTIQACRNGVVMITGKAGCGKTAFMSSLAQRFRDKYGDTLRHQVVVHFVGAAPGSSNLLATLTRLCQQLKKTFALTRNISQDFKNLVSDFPEFLKGVAFHCGSYPLLIFIDGVDMMENMHNAKNMEWIPMNIPEDIVFVVSVQDGGQCHKALLRRQPTHIALGPLDLLDKTLVVRKTLAVHRKTLEETAFNNQCVDKNQCTDMMKILVSKREANLPLFLSLACEELRIFGIFEQISDRLKTMAPTVPSLLQEVLQRLEKDHEKDLVTTALGLLVCVRDGIMEDELHTLLSLHLILGQKKYSYHDVKNVLLSTDDLMPQAIFVRLLRALKGFLTLTGGEQGMNRLSIAHVEVEKAVRQRYMKGAGAELERRLHVLLAGYFYSQADPDKDHTWSSKQKRPLSHLAYHLASANAYQELAKVLSSLQYIKVKCRLSLAGQLLEEYQAVGATAGVSAQRERKKFLAKLNMQAFSSFVSRNLHILTQYPTLTWQQAFNEPSESPVYQVISAIIDSSFVNKEMKIFKWENKAETEDACTRTITGYSQPVNCVSISAGDHFFASGCQDCSVKLYEMDTGKELKGFFGHSDGIVSCCFVGRQRLVTASLDGTLSLWDVEQGHRIAKLRGHRRLVNQCCSNANGTLIASASWDCSVKIWDGSTGRLQYTINAGTKPINSAAFHPEGHLIVTGCWDSTLKIWDTLTKKRVAILRGHKSSVRAVAYSPSGLHIASASLDGAVKLWNAKKGNQVGSLSGHSEPINDLCFSSNGQQLITASDDQKIKVWSGNLGKIILTFGKKNFSHATATSFSPNGTHIVVGYHDGHVRMYEANSNDEEFAVRYHELRVKSLTWCALPGGNMYILVGYDSGHVEVLNTNGTIILTVTESPCSPVSSVSYSPVNRLVAVTFEDNSIYLWRLAYDLKMSSTQTGHKPLAIMHATCNGIISCSDLSHDGTRLVTASRDASIFVWSTEQGTLESGGPFRPLISMHGCHKDWINTCTFAENADSLVTASNDFTLKLWDLKTETEKYHFVGHNSTINSVAYAHGCVVSACFDGTVKIWTLKGEEITTLYGHTQRVNSCDIFVQAPDQQDSDLADFESDIEQREASWAALTATEEWDEEHQKKKLDKVSKVKIENVSVVTASDDGLVQLWKPLQGNEQVSLIGHSDHVTSVAISSKGQLVSGSLDKVLKMWRPKIEDECLDEGHESEVTCIAYNHHDQVPMAVSTGRDGHAIVWLLPQSCDYEQGTAKIVKGFSVQVSEKSANTACFLTNAKFAAGSDDGAVTIWEMIKPTAVGHKGKIKLAQTIKLQSGKKSGLTSTECNSPVTCIVYENTTDLLYTGHWHGMIVMFKGSTGEQLKVVRDVEDWILDMKCFSDGSLLVSSSSQPEVTYFTKPTLQSPATISIAAESNNMASSDTRRQACWVQSVELLQHSTLKPILIGDSWGRLSVHNPNKSVPFQKKVHSGAIIGLAATSQVICTASSDGTLKLWDKDTFKQVGQFFCRAPVTCLTSRISAGRTWFYCGDKLGNVYILEWNKKRQSQKESDF